MPDTFLKIKIHLWGSGSCDGVLAYSWIGREEPKLLNW